MSQIAQWIRCKFFSLKIRWRKFGTNVMSASGTIKNMLHQPLAPKECGWGAGSGWRTGPNKCNRLPSDFPTCRSWQIFSTTKIRSYLQQTSQCQGPTEESGVLKHHMICNGTERALRRHLTYDNQPFYPRFLLYNAPERHKIALKELGWSLMNLDELGWTKMN